MSKNHQELPVNESMEISPLQHSETRDKDYGASHSTSTLELQRLIENRNFVSSKREKENHNNSGAPTEGVPWKIYVSRALSAWGDRIWAFGLGIFMNKIAPESLRLVAIQGFVISISVIIFGSAIGNWIDRNKRLLAAKIFLSIQNIAVAIACAIVAIHFVLLSEQVIIIFFNVIN